MTYGALPTPEEETQQVASFKKTVAMVFAATCLVGAVVGMSSLAVNRSASTVNANKGKSMLAAVPGVAEKTAEVLNMTDYNLRWAVFTFLPCCHFTQGQECADCKMIPTVQGKRSSDWSADFEAMKSSIDDLQVAAVVYNFEYFVSDSESANKPVLLTYANPTADSKAIANGGYFLGSVLAATDDVEEHKPLNDISNLDYQTFCKDIMGVPEDMCALEGDFRNCPFQTGICDDPVCAGASFNNPDEATAEGSGIDDACCEAMELFCADPTTKEDAGCHATRLRAVSRLCQVDDADEIPEIVLPEGETQLCETKCLQPCAILELDEDNEGDSYKLCSDCHQDFRFDDRIGGKAQCFPGALKFVDKRCCGYNEACSAEQSQTEAMCATLDGDEYLCQFIEHKDCPELVLSQAPIGCCDGEDGISELNCQGEFAAGDCPAPVVEEEPAAEDAE